MAGIFAKCPNCGKTNTGYANRVFKCGSCGLVFCGDCGKVYASCPDMCPACGAKGAKKLGTLG